MHIHLIFCGQETKPLVRADNFMNTLSIPYSFLNFLSLTKISKMYNCMLPCSLRGGGVDKWPFC